MKRTLIASLVLSCMTLTASPAFAAGHDRPLSLRAAAAREAARYATPVAAPQSAAGRGSGGGPVMWGAVIGGATGALGGALQPTHSNGEYVLGGSRATSALVLGAIGAGLGALAGWGLKNLRD